MFLQFFTYINDFLWNNFIIILLPAIHIYNTVKTGFVQKRLFKGIRLSVKRTASGDGISPFKAITCTLASTIGTGNIIGVGTAIVLGGPGAVFWCWIGGLLGIATKYAETYLAVKYRTKTKDGFYRGGAMYLLKNQLNMPISAVLFSVFGLAASFGIGCAIQTGAISKTLKNCFSDTVLLSVSGINITAVELFTGIAAGLLCSVSIIGGVKSVSKISEILVPAMALLYTGGCLFLLVSNRHYLPDAFASILSEAFGFKSIAGGFTGALFINACRYGISKGLFSGESGMGSAPLISVEAQTDSPDTIALITSTGTFWDTGVLCFLTGLTAVTTAIATGIDISSVDGEALMYFVFSKIPYAGKLIIVTCILFFAFTTLLGWSCYGEKCCIFLFGENSVRKFRYLWVIASIISPFVPMIFIWCLSDLFNGLMTIPNIVAVFLLSNDIKNKQI